jgi:hypothetical protein
VDRRHRALEARDLEVERVARDAAGGPPLGGVGHLGLEPEPAGVAGHEIGDRVGDLVVDGLHDAVEVELGRVAEVGVERRAGHLAVVGGEHLLGLVEQVVDRGLVLRVGIDGLAVDPLHVDHLVVDDGHQERPARLIAAEARDLEAERVVVEPGGVPPLPGVGQRAREPARATAAGGGRGRSGGRRGAGGPLGDRDVVVAAPGEHPAQRQRAREDGHGEQAAVAHGGGGHGRCDAARRHEVPDPAHEAP